jgi:hypothetical protein
MLTSGSTIAAPQTAEQGAFSAGRGRKRVSRRGVAPRGVPDVTPERVPRRRAAASAPPLVALVLQHAGALLALHPATDAGRAALARPLVVGLVARLDAIGWQIGECGRRGERAQGERSEGFEEEHDGDAIVPLGRRLETRRNSRRSDLEAR